ncbi:hypothetical protein [Enterococcus massiliensis]|uniref:hypothetical protein n=1 Tax=Enterococcus massiliensis TaxID=1640685 RepID=UPI00065DF0A4|nr:hypothetical protein [Enterococcus massiliensis]
MKQYIQENRLKRFLLSCGAAAILSFLLHILSMEQILAFLPTDPLSETAYQQIASSQLFLHFFILSALLFSSGLLIYFKRSTKDEFIEATQLLVACQLLLLLRTFIFVFDPHSFSYLLLVGIQLLLVMMALFFYFMNFLKYPGHLIYALITLACLFIYLFSILYTLFLTEFNLPNTGSVLVDVFLIATLSVFVKNAEAVVAE